MRRLYTVLLYLFSPLLVARLLWKSIWLTSYRHRMGERFYWGKQLKTPVDIWLHGVSLGEVVAATPLVEALLGESYRILITCMTPTGSDYIRSRFGERVAHHYVPYDLPWCVRRFYKIYTPRLGLIMETELWPNLIYEAARFEVPLLLLNARLSDGAFKQYRYVDFMFKPILNQLMVILAQSKNDAERFRMLGAMRVEVLGNMKFDVSVPSLGDKAACFHWKEAWGVSRPVLMLASTHENEEQQILSCLDQLKVTIPDLLVLIAPRHPERFQTVLQLSERLGFKTGRRSQPSTIEETMEVMIIDTLGELLDFYQVSDYAFVGGSLVPIGGHNVLEPIAVQVPVLCGPYMQNSKSICEALCEQGALQKVETADELMRALSVMHQEVTVRIKQIAAASAVLQANRGTIAKYLIYINKVLGSRSLWA